MSHEKGPHLAIEVARRLEMRLILAGNVDIVDQEYFQSQVLPQVDNDLIQYVGEVDQARKRELLCGARCLLASINWPEPFGLFMVEAMACGTPVVAFNRGSAPEVVRHGVTGYVVETVAEMAEAVQKVHQINPSSCRRHVEESFSVSRLADDYLAAYQRILAAESLPSTARSATTGLITSAPFAKSREKPGHATS
jgi:glycosyltransferase involved in cell wall biosynthesis